MIVARGLGRGGPQILVAAGLGRSAAIDVPPSPSGAPGGRHQVPAPWQRALRQQLLEEDELLLLMAASIVATGQLH